MVADLAIRTYGVNRFVEDIRLHRNSRQIQRTFRKRPILHHTCATYSELPSYISTMVKVDIPVDILNCTYIQSVKNLQY